MSFGVENIFSKEPFSLIFSILLVLGITNFGILIQNYLKDRLNVRYITNHYFSPIIGSYIILFFAHPLSLLNLLNVFILKSVSLILIIFGIYFFLKFIKKYIIKYKIKFDNNFVLIISFILLFFIAASPITHADSLSYHLGTALNLIVNNGHNNDILPFDDKLVGGGEILIAFGLSFGLQQFGGLLQFSSLFSLIPIFKDKKNNKNLIFIIIILFTPVTIFLISSPKPQLMPCIATLIVFSYFIKYFNKRHNINLINFILTSMLFINFIIKFNFILSASILILVLLYENSLIKNKLKFLITTFISALLIVFPLFIYRLIIYDVSILNLFLSPLPLNIYGYENFHNVLTGDEKAKNIFNLIYPNSLGELSTIYGPAFLLIFFINIKQLNNRIKVYLFLLSVFFILGIIYGSSLNRFYFEIYICLLFILSIIGFKSSIFKNYIIKYFYFQSFIVFIGCIFFALKLFPGSLNGKFYKNVMHNSANDYSFISWANNYLDDNDVVLSYSRSIILFKVDTYFQDLTWYIDLKNKDSYKYINFLKRKKINRLVYGGKDLKLGEFQNCVGRQIAQKENVGRKVGRNPFNKGERYNGWIFEFKYENLPDCLF